MDEQMLKQLFDSEQIPVPDDNARKVSMNLAVAEFEKNQKISQGNGFLSRLIHRQPSLRREKMSFSNKKVIYGGLATACVALMVFTIAPDVVQNLQNKSVPQTFGDLSAVDIAGTLQKKEMMADSSVSGGASPTMRAAPEISEKVSAAASNAIVNQAMMGSVPMAPQVASGMAYDSISPIQQEFGRDKFRNVDENAVHQVVNDPVSTFSIDVDTASYSYARSSLNQGVLPQKDSVRVEEMVNYFDYAYPLPTKKDEPFSTNVVMKPSPWGDGKQLMTIGIKGYDIPKTNMPNSNLVFLLDTSGSMNEPNKLPLLKQSISMLLDNLKPTDTISIVVYAGSAGTVLPPTKIADKGTILMALQNLSAGGGTAGAEGIRQAYQLVESNFDKNAVNRVILGTDGDFNVGITNPEELKDFVEREKDKGIFLSVLGFGRGNYNDEMMQTLAQNGNGTAAYIDSINEARKVLVEEATSTLFPIAKDVKIQVEFNPATVAEYRLVGYETRALKTEDFNNDKVDAGDIGAGAEVTAIYELTTKGGKTAIDDSRYAPKAEVKSDATKELAFVKLRYKLPNENESKLITTPVAARTGMDNFSLKSETDWAVAVASFAQMLKGGTYTGKMTFDDVLKLAEANKGADPFGYRAEFITLIHKTKVAASLQAQPNGQGGVELPVVPMNGGGYVYPGAIEK
jgi:Ca-activated chloride channel family protein